MCAGRVEDLLLVRRFPCRSTPKGFDTNESKLDDLKGDITRAKTSIDYKYHNWYISTKCHINLPTRPLIAMLSND